MKIHISSYSPDLSSDYKKIQLDLFSVFPAEIASLDFFSSLGPPTNSTVAINGIL